MPTTASARNPRMSCQHAVVFGLTLFVIGLTNYVVMITFGWRKMIGIRCGLTLFIRDKRESQPIGRI